MRDEEIARRDTMELKFRAADISPMSYEEVLDEVLEIIERHAGDLMPAKVLVDGKGRWVRYSREVTRRRFAERNLKHSSWTVDLTRDEPEVSLSLYFYRASEDGRIPFLLWLRVRPFEFYREPIQGDERAQRLVSLVRDLSRLMPAHRGFAHSYTDASVNFEEYLERALGLPPISDVHWLDVYGRQVADAIGRERVLSTPAAHLEELPHGAVLLLTRPTPADFDTEEARVAQARALVHLNPSLSYDAVLATLRERSAAFVHVERNWDPDLVELLEYVVNHSLLHQRRRETERFNRFRPTVTEGLPLEQTRLSDYLNIEAAVDEYDVAAELLQHVPWAKPPIPELKSGGPGALPALDCHFWGFQYGKYMKKEEFEATLLRGVGAYLGNQLVNELGGRWVPRQNRDEAYVVLGDRAWLPFLRARRCLGPDRECVLNYSLTKFYREAERYVRGWKNAD